jgi:hypothetical protein
MNAQLKETVRRRARLRCEYCRLPEAIAELPFQFDHVIAEQHGGLATEDNLALARARCNRHTGPNLSGIDPGSGKLTRLFNPRLDAGAHTLFGTAQVYPRERRSAERPLQFFKCNYSALSASGRMK